MYMLVAIAVTVLVIALAWRGIEAMDVAPVDGEVIRVEANGTRTHYTTGIVSPTGIAVSGANRCAGSRRIASVRFSTWPSGASTRPLPRPLRPTEAWTCW